jgi:prepilin-type N-terminal cleavage/methylation domain-containing protein
MMTRYMSVPEPGARGFSFVEVLVAVAILLTAMAALLQVAASGQRLARSQGEATDLHQRVRVAAEALQRDLALAGAGPVRGRMQGALTSYLAPLVPARRGARAPDAPLSAFTDRISIVYAAEGAWPTALSVDMSAPSDAVPVSPTAPGCPTAGLCGFDEGTRALLVDTSGVGAGHDLFTVTRLAGALDHDAPNPPFHRAYGASGSIVVPIVQRVYYFDRANRRLMLYDGYRTDMPFIDNVVDLRFAYFADAAPSSVARPPDGTGSCVYFSGSPPVPRLDDLGGAGLQQLTVAQMTDGPVCGAGPESFDGDLLRIRLVRVTLRLDAAADEVRGTGALFMRPGRSSSAYSYVPDFEVTFDVAPRNMSPAVLGR